MLIPLLEIILGLCAVILSADRLVVGASSLARYFGVSSLMVGLTVISLGTSSPEFIVTLMASLNDNASLAVGTAIGSNITNIALIVGTCALIRPLIINKALIFQQLPALLVLNFTSCITLFLFNLSIISGVVLALLTIGYLVFLFHLSKRESPNQSPLPIEDLPPMLPPVKAAAWLLFGIIVLPLSADYFVAGASTLARNIGINDFVIGLSMVAIGTSLPELAASIAALARKDDAMVVGNVVGSNIFNLSLVLLPPAFLSHHTLSDGLFTRDIPIMLALTVLLYLVCFSQNKHGTVTRLEGAALLAFYMTYLVIILS